MCPVAVPRICNLPFSAIHTLSGKGCPWPLCRTPRSEGRWKAGASVFGSRLDARLPPGSSEGRLTSFKLKNVLGGINHHHPYSKLSLGGQMQVVFPPPPVPWEAIKFVFDLGKKEIFRNTGRAVCEPGVPINADTTQVPLHFPQGRLCFWKCQRQGRVPQGIFEGVSGLVQRGCKWLWKQEGLRSGSMPGSHHPLGEGWPYSFDSFAGDLSCTAMTPGLSGTHCGTPDT